MTTKPRWLVPIRKTLYTGRSQKSTIPVRAHVDEWGAQKIASHRAQKNDFTVKLLEIDHAISYATHVCRHGECRF